MALVGEASVVFSRRPKLRLRDDVVLTLLAWAEIACVLLLGPAGRVAVGHMASICCNVCLFLLTLAPQKISRRDEGRVTSRIDVPGGIGCRFISIVR